MRKLNFKPMFWLIGIIIFSMIIGIGILSCAEEDGDSPGDGPSNTPKTIKDITVTYNQTTVYNVGDPVTKFNKANGELVVIANYTDGTKSGNVAAKCELYTLNFSVKGLLQVTVLYAEGNSSGTGSISINVTEVGAAIITPPTFSPLSGTSHVSSVSVTISGPQGADIYYTTGDGDPKAGTKYSSPFSITTVGATTVRAVAVIGTNNSSAASATYTVTNPVGSKTISGIEITTPPTKTTYTAGEAFDKSGMVVSIKYSDGSKEPTTGYTVGQMPATTGTITIFYQEGLYFEQATVSLTINPVQGSKTLTGISFISTPTKTSYTANENISTAGMSVEALYSDMTRENVTSQCTINPTTATASGNVTVTFQGKELTFAITVPGVGPGPGPDPTTLTVTAYPPPEGTYETDTLDVTLSTKTGATIMFSTTSGTNLIGEGSTYTAGQKITLPKGSTTIYAMAMEGDSYSDVYNFAYYVGKDEVIVVGGEWVTVWFAIPPEYQYGGSAATDGWTEVICTTGTGVDIKEIYWADTMTTSDPKFKVDLTIGSGKLKRIGWGFDGVELPTYVDGGLLKIRPKNDKGGIHGSFNLAGAAWDYKNGFDPMGTMSDADGTEWKIRGPNNSLLQYQSAKFIGITIPKSSVDNNGWPTVTDDARFLFKQSAGDINKAKARINQFSTNGVIPPGREWPAQ